MVQPTGPRAGSDELTDRLLQAAIEVFAEGLVRAGEKRATCQAKFVYDRGEAPWPKVGRRDIALEWDGSPALVIETISLEEHAFMDVPEDFALAEGENETLQGWRDDHRRWFEKTCGYAPDMMLVCERFKVVEDFG